MESLLFFGDKTIFVTAKTRGIDAEREEEKSISTLSSSSYATMHKKKISRPAKIGQNQPFWTK